MSDINVADIISALSGGAALSGGVPRLPGGTGDSASAIKDALSGDAAAKLGDALSGDTAAKLGDALGSGALGSKLADVLKNADLPSLLSSLGVTGASGASGSTDGGTSGGTGGAGGASSAVGALPAIFGALAGNRGRSAERRALLTALRPFVSERRKRAIDTLVGIEKLTAVFPEVR